MDDLTARIAAMVADWRAAGQHGQAEHFRRQMWELLGPYIRGSDAPRR